MSPNNSDLLNIPPNFFKLLLTYDCTCEKTVDSVDLTVCPVKFGSKLNVTITSRYVVCGSSNTVSIERIERLFDTSCTIEFLTAVFCASVVPSSNTRDAYTLPKSAGTLSSPPQAIASVTVE